jgi:hypothetical protein
MKFENLTRAMLPAGFVFGLFASQQAFLLTASDNSVVGQGTFEETSDAIVQVKATVQGQEFTGSGIIRENSGLSTLSKQRQGIRSDRALSESLSMKHRKHAKVFMVSRSEAKLACEFTNSGGEISGQCIDPDNQQQMLTIKAAPGEHS